MINQAIQALLNEDKISGEAAEALQEHALTARKTIENAMTEAINKCTIAIEQANDAAQLSVRELAFAIAQHHAERSSAIAGIIGAPPVEFKQAAE